MSDDGAWGSCPSGLLSLGKIWWVPWVPGALLWRRGGHTNGPPPWRSQVFIHVWLASRNPQARSSVPALQTWRSVIFYCWLLVVHSAVFRMIKAELPESEQTTVMIRNKYTPVTGVSVCIKQLSCCLSAWVCLWFFFCSQRWWWRFMLLIWRARPSRLPSAFGRTWTRRSLNSNSLLHRFLTLSLFTVFCFNHLLRKLSNIVVSVILM